MLNSCFFKQTLRFGRPNISKFVSHWLDPTRNRPVKQTLYPLGQLTKNYQLTKSLRYFHSFCNTVWSSTSGKRNRKYFFPSRVFSLQTLTVFIKMKHGKKKPAIVVSIRFKALRRRRRINQPTSIPIEHGRNAKV